MKAVIFDFNGTLFYDSDKHEQAWKIYLEDLCGIKLTDEDVKEHIQGVNNTNIIHYFTKTDYSFEKLRELGEKKESLYRKLAFEDKANFKLMKDATKAFDFLKENNIPFTIATASPKSNMDFYFKHFGLSKWFDENLVVYDDGTLPGKPDPALYLKACKNLNVNPKDAVVIEDASSGIKSAKNAGVGKVIAIATTSSREYFEKMDIVDEIIDGFEDFKNIIK